MNATNISITSTTSGTTPKPRSSIPRGRLVYRSNQLGSDQRITNTGGGNTSSKLTETDPLTGEAGRGAVGQGFRRRSAHLARGKIFPRSTRTSCSACKRLYARAADKGLKIAGRGRHGRACTPTAPSISTRARPPSTRRCTASFPAKHVDHMHPERGHRRSPPRRNCEKLTQEIFGGEVVYVPWMRPGFELGLAHAGNLQAKSRRRRAIMMGQHGFINWADDDKECYERTLDFIEKAAAIHRGEIRRPKAATPRRSAAQNIRRSRRKQRQRRFRRDPAVAARAGSASRSASSAPIQDDETILRFVNSARRAAPRRTRHQSAPTISCARRSSRSTSTGIRRPKMSAALKKKLADGPRAVSQGLRGLLRQVQARQFARDARPEPDGRC